MRLPSLRAFSHDAKQLILSSGLIAVSFFGVFSLLRSLYLLRLGFGAPYVGAYYATGAFTFMAMGVPSGLLGQRFGTRRMMLVGSWLTVIGMSILPLLEMLMPAHGATWPFVSQLVMTVGWSMINVNTVPALMAVTRAPDRSSAYAMTSALRGIGTFGGTVVGGILPGLLAGFVGTDVQDPIPYGYALLVGALLGLLSIGPLLRIRGGGRPPADDVATRQRGPFPLLPVAAVIIYVFLRHTGWTTCQSFCTPYLDTELRIPTSTIGIINGAGQVAAIGVAFLIPRLSERWDHGWIVTASTGILSVSLAVLAIASHWSTVAFGMLGIQVAASLWLPSLQVFQMELVSEGWRGLSYGAVTMAMGSGFGSMSLFGGYFIDAQGYKKLFMLGVGLAIAGTVLMAAISQRVSRRARESR